MVLAQATPQPSRKKTQIMALQSSTSQQANPNNIAPTKHRYDEQHPFFMLVIILAVVCVAANFIPSGNYERVVVDGRTLVDPTTFEYVDKTYIGLEDFFLSFFEGFKAASGLIAMVLFVGGAFGVIKRIGLMDAAIMALVTKLKNSHFMPMSLTLMGAFGCFVSFTGMYELSLVLVPLIVPLYLRLGYDVLVGTAVVMVAACSGLAAGMTNPYFTAIAQNIAELPLYSGIGYRFVVFLALLTTGVIFIYLYARKVKANPDASLLRGMPSKFNEAKEINYEMTPALKRAGIVFVAMFGFLIYGTVFQGYSFAQMSATFVAMAVFIGLAYGAGPNKICHMFAEGMGDLMVAALVIFFARSILFVMEESHVIDTVIYALAGLIQGFSTELSAILIFFIQSAINFLIPSGSGQAAITMPIIVPLADMMDVQRQTAILASQMGDAMSNFIFPTNGALIAILSVAGIPYKKWLLFFGPLFLLFALAAIVLASIAVQINYGPF